MNRVQLFVDQFYDQAICLSNAFSITREHDWNALIILNELSVQLGQIYNIMYDNEVVGERNRKFCNLGDELSDVLLQLLSLYDCMYSDPIRIQSEFREIHWMSLPILLGQLNEAVMEKYGYRFNKPREGFEKLDDFIQHRIFLLLSIVFQIAAFHGLDMSFEFSEMILDANNFLNQNFVSQMQ